MYGPSNRFLLALAITVVVQTSVTVAAVLPVSTPNTADPDRVAKLVPVEVDIEAEELGTPIKTPFTTGFWTESLIGTFHESSVAGAM